jgi:hypothetical protein
MPKFIMQSAFTFIALRCPRGKLYSRQCVPLVRRIYPLRSQEREEPHGLRGLVAAKKQENKAGPQKKQKTGLNVAIRMQPASLASIDVRGEMKNPHRA